MNSQITTLNLARKWRSKDFDHIIGQELSVKILKNSLYLGHYFPVYLFAGQRGCGKTTTARVFAAALNCHQLKNFQSNPKQCSVPCLACPSCVAMAHGNHPDFSEIDAASHTGVDTIRTIIEASQLLPIMGSKKIYLIDEAHMLSKASCNALLKILEEPPQSVVFMLATTDPQKIIETVRSRCFQLLFKPVQAPTLLDHLITVCNAESIAYQEAGLEIIIQETDGSVRDAINLLEQVRFAHSSVSKEAVLSVLGHMDDEQLIELFETVFTQDAPTLLRFLQRINFTAWSADFLWHRCIAFLRTALWIKYGVEPDQFMHYKERIATLLKKYPHLQLHTLCDVFYAKEPLFLRTSSKHTLLEMILLQISQKNKKTDDNSSAGTPVVQEGASHQAQQQDEVEDDVEVEEDFQGAKPSGSQNQVHNQWDSFVQSVHTLNDPLLSSVFRQGTFCSYDEATGALQVEFSKELTFFNDWLQETHSLWFPLLKKAFSDKVQFTPTFVATAPKKIGGEGMSVSTAQKAVIIPQSAVKREPTPVPVSTPVRKQFTPYGQQNSVRARTVREPKIDISNAEQWPKANLIARYFPGIVTEYKQNDMSTGALEKQRGM